MLEKNQILSSLQHYKKQHQHQLCRFRRHRYFRSYAKNCATEKSDIDVYVKLKNSNLFLLSRMRLELEGDVWCTRQILFKYEIK